jgi:hypothetical protein
MNRSCVPEPISSMPSCALIANLARGPPHLDAFGLDGDGEANRRCRFVRDVDMDAEAALASVEMWRQQLNRSIP